MSVCFICGKECKKIHAHLMHNHKEYNSEKYYLKFMGSSGLCLTCGIPTKFISIERGYQQYCSSRCSNNSPKVKEKKKNTTLKNYGVENPSQSDIIKKVKKGTCLKHFNVENPNQCTEIKDKIRQTCLEKYGVSNPNQNSVIKEKKKNTTLKNYGVENPMMSENIKEKYKNTLLNRYGVTHNSQTNSFKQSYVSTCMKKYGTTNVLSCKEIKDRIKETNLKKYGVENPSQNETIKYKRSNTCLKKFGVSFFLQNREIRKNIEKTNLLKYGVINPLKSFEIREKIKKTNLERYGTEYPLQSEKVINKMRYKYYRKLLNSDRLKDVVIPLFSEEDYKGININYLWECVICHKSFEDHLDDGHIPRCPICYPKLLSVSIFEKEVSAFCKQYFPNLIENDRSILDGKELDIYIPEINLAIECDGIYWHSELNGKDYLYHLNKTIECEKKNIQLIHIFEDEWYNKQDIVKSILLSKMGKIENKIYARNCIVKYVSSNIANDFLFEHHLQSFINGNFLGLYYNGELVSMISYGKPRYNKDFDYEIYRFCNKKNTIVVGGLSKLINNIPGKIISYCDRRYSNGSGYLRSNFKLVSKTKPNYFYLNDNKRFNRMGFQKHKLRDKLNRFDEILTEWQNMQLNGYDRIWDCGNLVFSYDN